MLDYLVTSNTRRELLKLLWGEDQSGTVHELAKKAGVAYAGAYRELKEMASVGLASVKWQGARKSFEANDGHPHAKLLRTLSRQPADQREVLEHSSDGLKSKLAELGLPVLAVAPNKDHDEVTNVEKLLLDAVELSASDASVARSLPVLFARLEDRIDYAELKKLSVQAESKHRVGFFLELTGELSGNANMSRVAESFFDKRRKVLRPFFTKHSQSRYSKALAEKRSPDLARKWGWSMNMGLDGFESTFRKFAGEAVRH